jgi:hypothetical protein
LLNVGAWAADLGACACARVPAMATVHATAHTSLIGNLLRIQSMIADLNRRESLVAGIRD